MNRIPTTSPGLEAKVKRNLATLLYAQASGSNLVLLIACSVIAFRIANIEDRSLIITWWLVVAFITIARMINTLYWNKRTKETEFDGKQEILRFSVPAILSSALIGSLPFFTFWDTDFLERTIMVVIFAGLAGGASTVLSSDRRLALTYISLLLIPVSILSLIHPDSGMNLVGILCFFYWSILIISILQHSSFIRRAAMLRYYNEELLGAIAEEKRQVELSNQKLQLAYQEINRVNEELERKVQDRTQALSVLASTDDLTGLKNRHSFVETLDSKIKAAEKGGELFSIFFVDLDGFKEINDIRGHLIGDQVLKAIAGRLRLSVKNRDFLCRWGGDEFVLVIEESQPLVLDTISTRICQSVQQPLNVDYDTIKITASVGIATYPKHGSNSTDLVNAADIAMYELKKSGKNGTMLFESAFLEKIRFEQHLLSGLNKAIGNQEFDVHYQVMQPCDSEDPIVHEGLIRWKFEGALIPPVLFIPIAETCDTIFDIGNWILKRVCDDLQQNKLGVDSRISINISVRQLLSRNFVTVVQQYLNEYNIESWRLLIEITESVFANDLDQARTVLNQLHELGVKVALDDFGSGFSSLSYLQALPIDIIKIDQSFVRQIDQGGDKIIAATLSIAQAFGCKVVAEGVESAEQQQRLLDLGVDYLQGFHIAKPLPPHENEYGWQKQRPLL